MTERPPMTGSMFRRLLVVSFLLIGVTLAGLDLYLSRYMARRHVEEVEQRLSGEGRILAAEIAKTPVSELEAWSRQAARYAQARVTVISDTGAVLGDSHYGPETMENHAGRPEVRTALEGKIGTAVRFSATVGRNLSYVAVPAEYDGKRGVVRLALPLEEVGSVIAEVRRRIFHASLVAALAALTVAYLFSRSLAGRVRRLKLFAEKLLDSNAPPSPLPPAGDELDSLARSMSVMAGQIRDLIGKLQVEGERRKAILDGMVEGVLAVDRNMRVTFCNQAFAKAVGASYPVPDHLPLLELIRDPQIYKLLHEALASGPRKKRLQLLGTEMRAYEVLVSPLESEPGRGAIALLHDITDLERLDRVRKDFVANVSHELRTPLTAIRGYAETLLDGALEDSDNSRRFVGIIHSHAIRLNQIASDLLVLSELDAGKTQSALEAISVRGAIEAALLSVRSEAELRRVEIHCGRMEDFEVFGDRVRLEQALINLLDNAVKFNRPGGQVRVETKRSDGQGHIVIADTGAGIPSDELPRIFERFYRVDKARSREVGGTGLGLSIVKHIAEIMGGSITVESRLGAGSTFTLILPCLAK